MKRPPPITDGDIGSPGSKRRRRISTSEDDDSSRPPLPTTPGFQSPPLHKIYNSSRKDKPDELFRKDLISAMKLPDSEQLDESEFWDMSDSWRQEWERGVQVPVNSKNVPHPVVRVIREKTKGAGFKLPKKLMRTTEDSFFSNEHHVLTDTAAKAESVCKYDMDNLDFQWLNNYNEMRVEMGLSTLDEVTLERVEEDFELQCSNRFQDALKTEKGLGIEYDEDVICDVCRSPDCEEGNEMVFCDSCNICVHQACYGIMAIPEGSWICRPCSLNIKPPCMLCPNVGGAMKPTSAGEKWAHVSCALWIPEVSIGCPEKMEPVTKISQIPASRWALICTLCRERVGACIQCSVKQCKTAYHVTCAFENGLEMEMKTTAIDSSEEGVKMQSFCNKHSSKGENSERSPPVPKSPSIKKSTRKKKEIKNKDAETEVDEHNARLQKIRSLEAQFHKYVNVKDTVDLYNIDRDVVDFINYYWVLRRRAKFNKPLLITKCDEANLLIKQHENRLYSRLKMFVHLRQDLERVRNLCYMVSKREKMFRSFLKVKKEIFEKQNEILTNKSFKLNPKEKEEVLKSRVGEQLFEKIYCSDPVEDAKEEKPNKNSLPKPPNPYAKSYINSMHTRSRRRTTSQNMTESGNEHCESENNEMPTLVKCKSEENLSSNDTKNKQETPSFTHSPFVIKIESKKDDKEQSSSVIKQEVETLNEEKNVTEKKDSPERDQSKKPEQLCDLDMSKISSENLTVKTKKLICENETSNDKNSLCLSDKENINALNPIKIKKTRSQTDSRHPELKNNIHELSNPKLELFDDENSLNITPDLNSPERRNFRLDRRSTRYQMRSRRCSSDLLEHDELPSKSIELVEAQIALSSPIINSHSPSSNNIEKLTLVPEINSRTDETSPSDNSPVLTPKRGRGRPRKIVQPEMTPDVKFTVIKSDVVVGDKNNSLEGILELPDSIESPGFRMSLRHNRECNLKKNSEQKQKNKRSVIIKLEHPETKPLKEANKDMVEENGDISNELIPSSPDWDPEDAQPPSLGSMEQPASTRIIIRLRKDPNRESWKNDSSSSSDVPVAFRIVSNDLDVNCENSVSEFPSIIGDGGSPSNQTCREDSESRHRYSMRERSVVSKNVKCAVEKS